MNIEKPEYKSGDYSRNMPADDGDVELLCAAVSETMDVLMSQTNLGELELEEKLAPSGTQDEEFSRMLRKTVRAVALRADVNSDELEHVISYGGSLDDMLTRLRASRTCGLHPPGNA